MSKLLLHARRPTVPKPPSVMRRPSPSNILSRMYSSGNNDDSSEGIMQKATSTAEEFTRQAKEKTDTVKDTTKEVLEDAKEAITSETHAEKDKFKEKVEKGNYDKIGRD